MKVTTTKSLGTFAKQNKWSDINLSDPKLEDFMVVQFVNTKSLQIVHKNMIVKTTSKDGTSKFSVHYNQSINDDLNQMAATESSVYKSWQLIPIKIKYKTSESIKVIN